MFLLWDNGFQGFNMIFFGYFVCFLAVLLVIIAITLQVKTKCLIIELKKNKELYVNAGNPTSTYFIMSFLCFMDYKFAIFICKNKCLDGIFLDCYDSYKEIRLLTIILFVIDIMFLLLILSLIVWHEFFY